MQRIAPFDRFLKGKQGGALVFELFFFPCQALIGFTGIAKCLLLGAHRRDRTFQLLQLLVVLGKLCGMKLQLGLQLQKLCLQLVSLFIGGKFLFKQGELAIQLVDLRLLFLLLGKLPLIPLQQLLLCLLLLQGKLEGVGNLCKLLCSAKVGIDRCQLLFQRLQLLLLRLLFPLILGQKLLKP